MLFSINQSVSQLWRQKRNLLTQLSQFSNQSVLDSIYEKQELHQKITDFIYEQFFDSALGGLIQEDDGFYQKPIIANLYLSEILIAADRVFYDGEFSNVAKKINDYFFANNWRRNILLLKDLDGYIKINDLTKLLNDDELSLLDSLVMTSASDADTEKLIAEKIKNDGFVVSYQRSLHQAAKNINMHFKQAQIIEQGLLMKITEHLRSDNNKFSGSQSLNFNQSCQLVITMSHSCLLKANSTTQQQVFKHYEELLENQEDDLESVIRVVFAGITLLQLAFDLSIVRQLVKLLEMSLSNVVVHELGEEMKYQFDVVVSFFNSVRKLNLNLIDLSFISDSYHSKNNIAIQFFEKNDPTTSDSIVKLRSSYYPSQFIFSL